MTHLDELTATIRDWLDERRPPDVPSAMRWMRNEPWTADVDTHDLDFFLLVRRLFTESRDTEVAVVAEASVPSIPESDSPKTEWTEDFVDELRFFLIDNPADTYRAVLRNINHRGFASHWNLADAPQDALEALVERLLPKYGRSGHDDAWTVDAYLDHLIDDGFDETEWIIPGLLAEGDRAIVTGTTGAGKSTLVTQVGVQVASGVNPFTGASMKPRRVLIVDAENPRDVLRDRLQRLRAIASSRLDDPSRLTIKSTDSQSWNLTDPDEFAVLADIVERRQIDLVVLGPLYKLRDGDPKEEHNARRLSDHLDTLRSDHRCAVIIEAHPTKEGKTTVPAGAALWTQWPEIGVTLTADGHLRYWRPPRRDGVRVPTRLVRGGEWPWSARFDPPAATVAPVSADMAQTVLDFLVRHKGTEFARTMLASKMRAEGVKCRDTAVTSALDELVKLGKVAEREDGRSRFYRCGVRADDLI
jgi:hypothetical protein